MIWTFEGRPDPKDGWLKNWVQEVGSQTSVTCIAKFSLTTI